MDVENDLITIKEVMKRLKLTRQTVYRWKLPFYKIGGRLLFNWKEIIEFIKEKRHSYD